MATEIASVMVQCVWDPGPVTAPTIRITPNVLEVKRGTGGVYRVYVDLYDGEDRVDYGGDFICSTLGGDTGTEVAPGLRWYFEVNSGRFCYRFLYFNTDINADIPFTVTYKGIQYHCILPVRSVGERGSRGPKLRGPMFWDDCPEGFEFESGAEGESFADIVIYKNVWYDCKKGHTKASNNYPGSDLDATNGLWSMATVFDFVATKIFMATYALVKNLGVEVIQMKDPNGNILFEAMDGHVTCNTGNFKNINISGNSTFRGFVFHEKTEITASNYALMSTTMTYAPGYTRTELDLMKTGNWIEIKSLPTSDTDHYTSLPAIRPTEKYTDAYRDYVRQFMGNELMIYNTSGKSIAIDTGENSVEIKDDYACYFRMVIVPETSNGVKLERIKWEYTGPFQY